MDCFGCLIMYNAVAGACAEQKANATDTSYTLSELSFDSVTNSGTETLVELLNSPTQMILTTEPGSGEKLKAYAFDDATLPTFTTVEDEISENGKNPRGNCFGNNGNYLYVARQASPYLIRYTLSPAYDVGTSSPATQTRNTSLGSAQGIAFKDDGSVAYVITSTAVTILNMSTNWDITTVTSTSSASLGGTDDDGDTITSYTGIRFKPDGTKVFVSYRANNNPKVAEYALSTPWDLSTKSFTSSINIGINLGLYNATTNAYVAGLDWNSDGTKLFVNSIHIDFATSQTKVAMYS